MANYKIIENYKKIAHLVLHGDIESIGTVLLLDE